MRELSWICKFHEICHHKSVTLNELFTSFEFQWNRPRSTKMQKKLIYWQFLLRHCSIPTLRWIWHCTGYSQKLKKYLNSIFHILNLHKQMLAFIQMKNETRENWLRKPPGLLVKVIKFASSFTRRDENLLTFWPFLYSDSHILNHSMFSIDESSRYLSLYLNV